VFRESGQMAGDPMIKETMVGAVVDEGQFKRVMGFIESGKRESGVGGGWGEDLGSRASCATDVVFEAGKKREDL